MALQVRYLAGDLTHDAAHGWPVGLAKTWTEEMDLLENKEIKAVTLKRFFPSLFWKIIKKQSAT